jgi:hypothetical protein
MAPLRVMTAEKFLKVMRDQGFRPLPRLYVHGDPLLRRGPRASFQNGRFPSAPRSMETVYVTDAGRPPTPGDIIAGTGIMLAAATPGSRHMHSPGHRTGVRNWFNFFRNTDGSTPTRISSTVNNARPALQSMPAGSLILDAVPWPIAHPLNRLPAPNSVPFFGRADFVNTFVVLYDSGFTALHVGYAGGYDELLPGLHELEEFKVEQYEIQAPTCKLQVAVVSRSSGHLCVLFRSHHGVFLHDLEIAKQWAEAVGLIVKLAGGQPAMTTMELAHLLVSNSGGRTAGKAAVAPVGGSAAAECKAASTALGRGKSPARGESKAAAAQGRGTPPARGESKAAAVFRGSPLAQGESTAAAGAGVAVAAEGGG